MSTPAPPAPPAPETAVAPGGTAAAGAIDARKTYGMGDAQVNALDGVTVSFETGKFTAIMGPSGSGKSTLLHCLAGLDTLTSGATFIGDTYLAALDDKALTELRRTKVGFIFQAFNLIPTLDRRREHPPADDARRGDRRRRVDRPRRHHRRPQRPARSTGRASSPAASSSASPSPGRWRRARRSSSPTNRPATSTR